ncbi:MAG: tRNA(Ile)(2)-agmatinylcytidine synthase [Nitrososphaerota archaeon]|nr:tRNA(Ile)(2)-agmatinylcytidine synthase [Candidatus Bathyarchaeota archaeon]MDW8061526.1 tRNA(Ile)(2)-agmatinylcytidine synthase [Nitrososphaerota archaeon]
MHLGIDDTDSMRGGCTTYVAALLVEEYSKLGVTWLDYPNLIRLNPNIPWKTRGNGAISLRLEIDRSMVDDLVDIALKVVERESMIGDDGVDPVLAVYVGGVSDELRRFAYIAETDVVDVGYALKLADSVGVKRWVFKDPRGIVGALAAIGEDLKGDHTYELIAYRTMGMIGNPRMIDVDSVKAMDEATKGETYANIDYETGRILITPRGSDPVLYGIRGETPEAVYRAHTIIRSYEEVERWVIFRSNQCTDAHLRVKRTISLLKPYVAAVSEGIVSGRPTIIAGGHVIFKLDDGTGIVDCAVYEPTGGLRSVVSKLMAGDRVRVYGGVKPFDGRLTFNVEKIEIVELTKIYRAMNPVCPSCGRRMKSMGSGKGFRCDRCGFRDSDNSKIEINIDRGLKPGLYMPPPRAYRHLTKPPERYGREKTGGIVWFHPWHKP